MLEIKKQNYKNRKTGLRCFDRRSGHYYREKIIEKENKYTNISFLLFDLFIQNHNGTTSNNPIACKNGKNK
jgi:hypothetical protein